MQNKVITVTKIKNKKMSLTELVKNVEKFNVEDIPLNERNHILISKVFNKFNSLKKAHFKNAENKGIVKKIGTNEFKKVSYEYEITKTEWSNAVIKNQGIRDEFSTGSQNQKPPHPNS